MRRQMSQPQMIISLKEFALTGCFGPVRIGMTKAQVIGLLGPPDCDERLDYGNSDVLYGWYEFFFDEADRLFAMQNDSCNVEYPELVEYQSAIFQVDPWVLRTPRVHTLSSTQRLLTQDGMPHVVIPYCGRRVIRFPSDVVLDFAEEEDDPVVDGIRYFPKVPQRHPGD